MNGFHSAHVPRISRNVPRDTPKFRNTHSATERLHRLHLLEEQPVGATRLEGCLVGALRDDLFEVRLCDDSPVTRFLRRRALADFSGLRLAFHCTSSDAHATSRPCSKSVIKGPTGKSPRPMRFLAT